MGGQVVTLTTHHERAFAPLLREFVQTEASVVGSRYATRDEVVRSAPLLADGRVRAEYTRTVGLDELPAVHDAICAGEARGMAVLEP